MMTAQEEPWALALPEMKEFFSCHYDDLSLHKAAGFPLSISYDIYNAMEAQGQLLVVTLRFDGALVGYFVGFVKPGLHYNTCLTLQMDVYYIAQEHRNKAMGALKLFRKVEAVARKRGVAYIVHGSKLHKDSGRLFKALGYAPAEMWYGKFL
jgi:GNAT superfamily N-acetyltransferase